MLVFKETPEVSLTVSCEGLVAPYETKPFLVLIYQPFDYRSSNVKNAYVNIKSSKEK